MTGHETIIVPCDLIINIQWSVVTSPSNEQEGSLIKCLREISCLFDSPWEISNGVRMNLEPRTTQYHYY